MMPPKREFEKVPTDDFVKGIIEDYGYEAEHSFKGANERTGPAIRFKFVIDGLKFPKYTNWMSFSYHEKASLYAKYLTSLVAGATPYMKFDLDQLKGMKVKMLWKDNPKNADFQVLDTIRPLEAKIIPIEPIETTENPEEEIPF